MDTFDDLDELVARFVEPYMKTFRAVLGHRQAAPLGPRLHGSQPGGLGNASRPLSWRWPQRHLLPGNTKGDGWACCMVWCVVESPWRELVQGIRVAGCSQQGCSWPSSAA